MTEYKFDVEKVTTECIEWIRNYFSENGPTCNAVIGISGGKDSSVVAALCVKALGKNRVIGVLMPQGKQHDINYSHLLVDNLGITSFEINIAGAVDSIITESEFGPSYDSQTNLPARIRMSTLFYVAQSFNGRVSCNCNLSEDTVGYSTLFGDGVGQFAPIAKLTVTEIKEIGKYLGLPEELYNKVPEDGLSGLTDEENLGIKYSDLDSYIREGAGSSDVTQKILDKKAKNKFKLELMPIPAFDPNLPNFTE